MASFLSTLAQAGRRQKKRWLGSGPWRALPLARILALRHPPAAWHGPEGADGEIAAIPHPAIAFHPGHALLGQPARPLVIETGERRFRETGLAPAHTTTFWTLGAAGVIGEDGLVYCPRARAAVAETARTIWRSAPQHPELAFARPVTGRLAGTSLVLAGAFGHAHYHLLWDLLAKLALFPADLRHSIDHYLVGVPSSPVAEDWLRAAGVPLERVVWLRGSTHLLCEQVIFSNLPCEVTQPRPAIWQALHALLAGPASSVPGRARWLWISRRGLSQRDLLWEDQLLAALPKFERLDLATLSAQDQMRTFAGATVIAGPHGSGMANLVFVQGTGDLVEFFSEDQMDNPLYARFAQLAGWRHTWARVDFRQPAALAAVVAALKNRLPPA